MNQTIPEMLAATVRSLRAPDDSATTMRDAVAIAQRDIDGCDAAAITLVHKGGTVDTAAATHPSATYADVIQYQTRQGPCLSTVWESEHVDVPDIGQEERWPAWADRMRRESGYRSMHVRRLFTTSDTLGALNLYSQRPHTFTDDDRKLAAVVAAVVAAAVAETRTIEQLSVALGGRTTIGQAQGLLMERYDVDADAAFAILSRLSSQLNRKLRHLAEEIVRTRDLPEH